MAAAPFLLLLWTTALGLVEYHVWAQDPCSSYTSINDWTRSVFEEGASQYGDTGLNGWYRFIGRSGDSMLDYLPTTSSRYYRCNAEKPGYLLGQHPKGSEGIVSRTVCFIYSGSNCWWSTTIKVKNCGNFFVYKLHPLNSYSSLRYCGSGEVGKYIRITFR